MARALEELNRTLAERQEKRRRLLVQWSVLREEADKRSARAVDEVERVLDLLEDMDCQEDVGIARALDALMQVTEAG